MGLALRGDGATLPLKFVNFLAQMSSYQKSIAKTYSLHLNEIFLTQRALMLDQAYIERKVSKNLLHTYICRIISTIRTLILKCVLRKNFFAAKEIRCVCTAR